MITFTELRNIVLVIVAGFVIGTAALMASEPPTERFDIAADR